MSVKFSPCGGQCLVTNAANNGTLPGCPYRVCPRCHEARGPLQRLVGCINLFCQSCTLYDDRPPLRMDLVSFYFDVNFHILRIFMFAHIGQLQSIDWSLYGGLWPTDPPGKYSCGALKPTLRCFHPIAFNDV